MPHLGQNSLHGVGNLQGGSPVRRAEVKNGAFAEDPYCALPPTNAPPHLERCSVPCHGPAAWIWKRRYFNMARVWQRATRVNIKGFSAGSYVGLALVHVLRDIKSVRTSSVLGAIACPPLFLKMPDNRHTVHLIHYLPDKLRRWHPGQPFLRSQSSGWPHIGKRWSPWLPKG